MIKVTEAAKAYLEKVGDPNVSLTVKGGGCAGFQYEWGITDKDPYSRKSMVRSTSGNVYFWMYYRLCTGVRRLFFESDKSKRYCIMRMRRELWSII